MSAGAVSAGAVAGARPGWVRAGLVAGAAAGLLAAAIGGEGAERAAGVAELVGGLWLDGLRMTIVPLVLALVVVGVARAAEQARAGGLAARTLGLCLLLLIVSALVGALLVPPLLDAWTPAAPAVPGVAGEVPPLPPPGAWLRALVPPNIVKAAADGAIVGIVLFATLFGLAAARLPEESRARVLGPLGALGEAMLVVVGWVLWAAPLGVFALALVVAARAGAGVGAALAAYVGLHIVLSLVLIAVGVGVAAAAGVGPGRFVRAAAPAGAVGLATQSSLAALPPMLASAERLGVPPRTAAVVLPLAVATFKLTAPASATSLNSDIAAQSNRSTMSWAPASS